MHASLSAAEPCAVPLLCIEHADCMRPWARICLQAQAVYISCACRICCALQVFLGTVGASADPTPMLSRLAQLEAASDFFDGGQHDCQEVLRTLMNALHDDLVGYCTSAALHLCSLGLNGSCTRSQRP